MGIRTRPQLFHFQQPRFSTSASAGSGWGIGHLGVPYQVQSTSGPEGVKALLRAWPECPLITAPKDLDVRLLCILWTTVPLTGRLINHSTFLLSKEEVRHPADTISQGRADRVPSRHVPFKSQPVGMPYQGNGRLLSPRRLIRLSNEIKAPGRSCL